MHTLTILFVLSMAVSSIALEEWKDIEEHLTQNSKTDTAEATMAGALEWLEQLQPPTGKSKVRMNKNSWIIEGLQRIDKFNNSIKNRFCESDDYGFRQSLIAGIQACKSCPRLNTMAQFYAERHAECCQQENINLYKLAKQSIATKTLDYLRPFFDRLIYGDLTSAASAYDSAELQDNKDLGFEHDKYLEWAEKPGIQRQIYKKFILRTPDLYYDATFESAIKGLEHSIRAGEVPWKELAGVVEEIKSQKSMSADQFDQIFEPYIVGHCIQFQRSYRPYVFGLADQDIKYLKDRRFEQSGKDVADYYFAWAIHTTCLHMAKQPEYEKYVARKIKQILQQKTALQS